MKASTGEVSAESMMPDSDERAFCFESCNIGDEASSRCHGRDDVACSALEGGAAFCRPLCTNDSECGARYCDPLLGVCVDEPVAGLTLGTACDPDAADPECQGLCLTVDSLNYCSSRCIYGNAPDCGNRALGRPGLCFLPEGEGSIGDVGFCSQLCDCNGQCFHTDAICDPFNDGEIEELLQAKGVCMPAAGDSDGGAEGIPCPLE